MSKDRPEGTLGRAPEGTKVGFNFLNSHRRTDGQLGHKQMGWAFEKVDEKKRQAQSLEPDSV